MRLAPQASALASMKNVDVDDGRAGGSWCFRGSPPANDQHRKVRPPNTGHGLGRPDRSHRQNLDVIYGHFVTWNISSQFLAEDVSWSNEASVWQAATKKGMFTRYLSNPPISTQSRTLTSYSAPLAVILVGFCKTGASRYPAV